MTDQKPTEDEAVDPLGDLRDPKVPVVYISGFGVATSLSDVGVLVHTAGTSSAELRMSFTTAKTLAKELTNTITELEEITGQPILTMDDVKKAMDSRNEKTEDEE